MVPLSVMGKPGPAGLGAIDPVTLGGVGSELMVAVTLTSSIATPSSEPVVSVSVQRMKMEPPGLIDKPVITALMCVRHALEFPSVAPATAEQGFPREAKLSPARFVKVPVLRLRAEVLYAKVRPSAAVAGPRRHISPLNSIARAVTGP